MNEINKITPTDKQNAVIKGVVEWFKNPSDHRKILTIAGYAGTGKSSVVSFIVKELGLDDNEVVFAAYTGMAASVLLKKGNKNSSTIHKLIYNTKVKEDPLGIEKPKFYIELKEKLDENIKLIVIDEASMVNAKILEDLLSFGVKILAIGDHYQLPPIKGDNSLMKKPDFFLDEVLRQSLDNPIIYLSMLVRENKNIQYGSYGENVKIIKSNQLSNNLLKDSDQIIAGRNKTVNAFNKYYRKYILGIDNPFPVVNDKLICLKNDWNYYLEENNMGLYLVNGLQGHISSITAKREGLSSISELRDTALAKWEKAPLA